MTTKGKLTLPDDLLSSKFAEDRSSVKDQVWGGRSATDDKTASIFSDESKDQLGSDNNTLPLSPQWLYVKQPVDAKPGVQRLQEQLLKERDKRALLESILNVSQSPLSDSAISDEEMKEDLKEILQSEADVANLTQSVNDLGSEPDQHHDQTSDSAHDSSNQPRRASTHRAKRKDKLSNVAVALTSQLGRSSSKDTRANVTEGESETKYETTSSQQRHPHENPQLDRDWSSNSRSYADRTESEIDKKYESIYSQQKHPHKNAPLDPARSSNSRSSASADPKKSGTGSEERRSQIASELQNLDKGWGDDELTTQDKSNGSEMGQSQQNTVERQSSEVESFKTPNQQEDRKARSQ